MTGSSLGLRSSSYGSLQQQLQNGFPALQIQTSPVSVSVVSVRKTPNKMFLQGSREKERFLSWIFKFAGRRKVGMLLLLLVSAVVLFSLFSFSTKDEDGTPGVESNLGFSTLETNTKAHTVLLKVNSVSTRSPINNNSAGRVNSQIPLPVPIHPLNSIFTQHPCANFSFSPPPFNPKHTGPRPCPVCYVSVEQAVSLMPAVPSASPILSSLNYVSEENLVLNESNVGSVFGGYPSLQQRDKSFDIKDSMTVHCGFVKGKKPGQGTGFDIEESDLLEMEQCYGIVVASAIFGNYDVMQQPKNISEQSKRTICFYMFVDEETESYIKNSTIMDNTNRVGLWRVVVVRNLPYQDARRNGKVPKLLLHRLFPNVRYSIWIDGKLELVRDPYQILERFLWRENATLAISRHYRRFDVFVEAEANKAAGKYDNYSIDYQIEFYKKEGLTPYSEAKLPIISDVPEGCVIIREHMPITNLFTCLWFNEVDRFTSRDQLSFSTVRDKIRSKVNWMPHMFLDCERRDFVVQAYHRELLEKLKELAAMSKSPPPPPVVLNEIVTFNPSRKVNPVKRGKDRKPRRRKSRATAIGKENNFL